MAYDELPAWLRGHIHPYPGEEQGFSAGSAAETPAAGSFSESGLSGTAPFSDEAAPTSEDSGAAFSGAAEAGLPTELKGLTGQLPWLQDVGSSPDAAVSPGAADAPPPAAEPPPAPEASPITGESAEGLRGLTGQLPWMQDVGSSPDAQADEAGGALDWMATPADEEGEPATVADDLNWLAADEAAPEPAGEAPASVDEPPADEDLSWLATADQLEADILAEEEAAPEMATADSAVPDWLAAADDVPVEEEAPAAELPAVEAAVPDWLAAADTLADDAAAEADASDLTDLDWMAAADELLEDEAFAGDEPLPVETPEATPDWLAEAGELALEDDAADSIAANALVEETPAWALDDVNDLVEELPDDDISYADWQDIKEEEAYEPTVEEQLAEEVPDWFTDMAADTPARADDATGPLPQEPTPPGTGTAEFVPDWYLGLDEQDTSDAPEWFGNLDFSADALTAQPVLPTAPEPVEPAEPAMSEAPSPVAAGGDDEIPDWFADIAASPAAPAPDAPEWLADAGQPLADVPDWLADAGAVPSAPPTPPAPPAAEDGPPQIQAAPTSEPDFLTEELAPAADLPDWFEDMGAADTPATAPAGVPVEEPAADAGLDFLAEELAPGTDLPDWFEGMGASETPAHMPVEAAPIPPVEAPVDETFDFLAELPTPAEAATLDEVPAEPSVDVDWLGAFEADEAGEVSTPDAAPMPDDLAPGEAPDWLGDLAVPPEGSADGPAVSEDEALAALLAGGDDFMAVIEGEVGTGETRPATDAAPSLEDLLAAADMPALDGQPDTAAPTMPEALAGADMPDWLVAAQPGPDGIELSGGDYSVVGDALHQPEATDEELSDRLLALRDQTASIAAADEDADMAGPEILAGVTDILQPTAAFDSAEGRAVLLDVQLDEQQAAQVETLSALLGVADLHQPLGEAPPIFDEEFDEDGRPLASQDVEEDSEVAAASRIREADKRARARSSRKPTRMVVTLILLAAVILPFFVDFSGLIELPAPVLSPALHGEMDMALQTLQSGDLVLVGFEYGPTAAGEMDPLAETLLTHVLLRGARPVIVSTKAAGILHAADVLDALAHDEFLLAHLGRPNDPLTVPEDYVILSYLPGGIVGLRALTATSIDTAALDRGLFLVDYQGNPTRLNVRTMQRSFSLALTLAERGEDVRNWVEQVGTALDLPLLAGVSVAAEPVARPYLDSEQLLGLLAGYRDAYIYNRVLTASLPLVPTGQNPLQGMAEGLETIIPTPTLRLTATPVPPTVAAADDEAAPDETTEAEAGLLLEAEATTSSTPTVSPTPTERVIATVTPDIGAEEAQAAEETSVALGTGTPVPTTTFVPPPVLDGAVVRADQTLADERWYSMTVGALAIVGIIALGAIVNIIRSRRRRS